MSPQRTKQAASGLMLFHKMPKNTLHLPQDKSLQRVIGNHALVTLLLIIVFRRHGYFSLRIG